MASVSESDQRPPVEYVAHYEIRSELSVFQDDEWLKFEQPSQFRARVRNLVRSDFSTPFLLSLEIIFVAPSLRDAAEVAEDRLGDCLNMLALVTGGRFTRHRIRQIVDRTPGMQMRPCLMWADSLGHHDPEPFLDGRHGLSLTRLLSCSLPPVMRRAMRWYRLGVTHENPDDQFQCFWFALELIATATRSTEKVPDRCPHCRSPVFCETCQKHPMHRPYPKQAIRALISAVDESCDESTVALLDKTRNSLMHGTTLRELEEQLPDPHESIVDTLGRIVFRALLQQFPQDAFREEIAFGSPSTYVHRTLSGIADLRLPVPAGPDGELDLSFRGTQMQMVTDAPPQSARPSVLGMSLEQFKKLEHLRYRKGDHQELCRRVHDSATVRGNRVAVVVLSTDLKHIRTALRRGESGDWQALFREVLEEPPASEPERPEDASAPVGSTEPQERDN